MLAMSLLVELCIYKNAIEKFLIVAYRFLVVLILINLITIILFPNGMYTDYRNWRLNWFFGNYQQHIYMYLPAICFGSLLSVCKENRLSITVILMMFLILAAYLYVWSVTSLVAMTIVIFLMLFRNRIPQAINALSLFIASIAVSFGLIILKIQNVFGFFIEGVLKKSLTLSGRTVIWDTALTHIRKSLLFGYGMQEASVVEKFILMRTAHNQYLDALYIGGIVFLGLYIFINIIAANTLLKERSHAASKVITFTLCGYYIFFISEARRGNVMFFAILVLAYHLPKVIEQLSIYPEKNKRGQT